MYEGPAVLSKGGVTVWNLPQQVLSAGVQLGVEIREVPRAEFEALINALSQSHTSDGRSWPTWERLANRYSIQDDEAWRWIGDYIGAEPAILFFEPVEANLGFLFKSGLDLVAVLGELFGVEFYVTNPSADYVLCYNHHDCLIAAGLAVEWLQRRCNSVDEAQTGE